MFRPHSGPGWYRRDLLKTTAALALLFAVPGVARAAPSSNDAAAFVRSLADELLKVLSSNTTGAELRQEVSDLIARATDIDLIGRLVLGRAVRTASPAQLGEYQRLFSDYVLRSTVERLEQYDGNSYEVTGARQVSDTDALVDTNIARPGSPPCVSSGACARRKASSRSSTLSSRVSASSSRSATSSRP